MRENVRGWVGTVVRCLVAVIGASVLWLPMARAGGIHIHYSADAPRSSPRKTLIIMIA